MIFGSIPSYLDPANWQQPNHQTGTTIPPSPQCPSAPLQPPPLPPPTQPHVGSIRPGSMPDRARLANIPVPKAALDCPRCESTNTKFCYFNNYSLTQPRHFCKTCRRYWTRGGALRNVPVGGGCRRNRKRSNTKESSSNTAPNSSSSSTVSAASTSLLGFLPQIPPPPNFSISPLEGGQLSDTNFQLRNSNILGEGVGSIFSSSGGAIDQWRLQQAASSQLPFLGGLNPSSYGLYHFQDGLEAAESCFVGGEAESQIIRQRNSGTMLAQMGSVMKMEEINQEPRLLSSRPQFLRIPGNEEWACVGGSWSDISANLNSSSARNPS